MTTCLVCGDTEPCGTCRANTNDEPDWRLITNAMLAGFGYPPQDDDVLAPRPWKDTRNEHDRTL